MSDAPSTLSKIVVRDLSFYYGTFRALVDVNVEVRERQITALIGPSGCGKSTFLRTLNRMNDLIPETRVEGKVLLGDQDIYGPAMDVVDLRPVSYTHLTLPTIYSV